MLTSLETITVRVEGGAVWAAFDLPPVNLVTAALARDLRRLIDAVEGHPECRVIVFESSDEEFFLAHADMTAFGPEISDDLRSFPVTLRRLAASPTVSIAKIAGRARGAGSEFALACDMRFASAERAVLAQPEVGVGLLPGAGATQRLPRLVGRGRALEAILGADDFDATTAERYGWINRALPDEQLDPFVDELARRIASFPPAALAAAKRFVDRSTLPARADLAEESGSFARHARTPEALERCARLLGLGAQERTDTELSLGAAIAQLPAGR